MILQKLHDTGILLKSDMGILSLLADGTVKIGDYLIEGPGEYDISGIGLHVFTNYCVASCDGIQTVLIWGANSKIESDEASNDILVCLMEGVEQINDLVKSLDPRVIVFNNEAVATSVATHDGITLDSVSAYKISQTALPVDVRAAVLLT